MCLPRQWQMLSMVKVLRRGGEQVKILLSEAGQCIIYGVLFVIIITGFYQILEKITG